MKSRLFLLINWLVIASILLAGAGAAQAAVQPAPQAAIQAAPAESSLQNAIHLDDGRIAVIVQLADPPVATYAGGKPGLPATSPKAAGSGKLDAAGPASQAYTAYLESVQAQFVNQLASAAPSATVDYTYQTAFNGLALKLKPGEAAAVAKLPGVAAIYPDQLRTVQMDASLSLIKAQAEWARLGYPSGGGQGIKVADVDTGLDTDNPMFSGAGFSMPAGYPKGTCVVLSFQCNNKVIAGRYFFTAAAVLAGSSSLEPSEQMSPFGVVSHGTHTAGTAAGDAVTANVNGINFSLSGVAPAAYLMAYKALWGIITSGGVHTGSGADSDLVAALNAAVADGADVINNSWGGGAGDPNTSLYKPLIASITAAGTLVVFSAGNSGPGSSTIGCPGCVADALTVAASTTNRIVANTLNITGPGTVPPALTGIGAVNSDKPLLAPISGSIRYNAANPQGCTPFPASFFSGAVALILRGPCSFATKVVYAAAAGATAVIVFNNVSGPPVAMPGINGLSIPALMVDQTAGQAIRDWVVANPSSATVTVTQAAGRVINNAYQDILAGFSSVGPDGDPNVLKPDITAPGVNILSASSPVLYGPPATEPWYEFLQGTSMAAPHVTGAAALIKQQHPTWTPQQIRSALTTSAVQTLKQPDGVTPANPFNMGSGRLDVDRAGQAGLTFDRTSFASGNCVLYCSWTVNLTNVSGGPVSYTASTTSANPLLNLLVSPSSFSISAGASTSFTVTATVSAITDLASWNFGSVSWKDNAGLLPDAYFPLAVRPGTATRPMALTESVDKASARNGDAVAYTITVANPYANPAVITVESSLPNALIYQTGTATGGLVYDALNRKLSASLPMPAAQMDVAPTGQATRYVAGVPGAPGVLDLTLLCPISDPICDETVMNLPGQDFWYMGVHYTSATLSSNGFIIPGTVTTIPAFSSTNLSLPSLSSPTNIIAPLWSDLEFAKTGAKWLVWSNPTYTVIEWQNADQYGSSLGMLYSFEIWIKKGTGEISFAYGSLSSDVATVSSTHGYTVGAENLDGTLGKTYFYRPYGGGSASGSAPVVATDLNVLNSMTIASLGFSGYAAVPSAAAPLINNGVKASNDLNSDVQQAAALTTVTTFPVARIPFVSK